MKAVVCSDGRSLFPRDPHSEEIILGLRRNVDIIADIKQPRHVGQTRAIHALLHKVARNHTELTSVDAIKRYLKIESRMFDPFVSRDGKLYYALRSTSFENMEQAEFQLVWNQWRQIICEKVLPGITQDELALEILEGL